MSKKLTGKIALVTGASKGIGAEIALQLAKEGAAVVVNYSSSKEGADKVVAEIVGQGGKAIAVKANVSNQSEIKELMNAAKKAYGSLDILVNNAGIYEFSPLDEISPDHFHKQFNLNVLGLLLVSQEASRILKDGGSIINISSGVTKIAPPGSAVYSATKASVDAITMVLSKELAPRKIRVNAINPGMVETEGVKTAGFAEGDMRKWIESVTPLARIATVQDIAPAAVFLASNDSSYMTGETMHITGGFR